MEINDVAAVRFLQSRVAPPSPAMSTTRLVPQRFGPVARFLHWATLGLITLQLLLGNVLEAVPEGALRGLAYDSHETIGLCVLLLVLARLAWRLTHPQPPVPGPAWQRRVALCTHATLYVLMLAIPVLGYTMVDAKGYDVAFFGWSGVDWLPTNDALADSLKVLHAAFGWALIALVALHAGAALWHHFVARDDVLRRMLPGRASIRA